PATSTSDSVTCIADAVLMCGSASDGGDDAIVTIERENADTGAISVAAVIVRAARTAVAWLPTAEGGRRRKTATTAMIAIAKTTGAINARENQPRTGSPHPRRP